MVSCKNSDPTSKPKMEVQTFLTHTMVMFWFMTFYASVFIEQLVIWLNKPIFLLFQTLQYLGRFQSEVTFPISCMWNLTVHGSCWVPSSQGTYRSLFDSLICQSEAFLPQLPLKCFSTFSLVLNIDLLACCSLALDIIITNNLC